MSIAAPAGADRDALKRAAAYAAAELVQDGMIVGLGTGSTAAFALDALARRHQQGLRFVGIPTSERTAARAKALGIPLTSFTPHRQIDLTIDGADEVERSKGPAEPRHPRQYSHVDAEKLDLIGRMEGGWYTRTRERFEMPAIALEDWKGKP